MHQKHKLRKFQELHILNADRVYQIKVIYIYITSRMFSKFDKNSDSYRKYLIFVPYGN